MRAFVVTDCEGMARVDMFVRAGRRGARERAEHDPRASRETSVYAKLFEASGIGYGELLERLIDLALERHERRSKLEF